MRVKLLFDRDVLQSHRDHLLRLHLVYHFLLLDGHVVDDVLHLVVVRAHPLNGHLYLLLHVFDVTLLVRNVFHTPHHIACVSYWPRRRALTRMREACHSLHMHQVKVRQHRL